MECIEKTVDFLLSYDNHSFLFLRAEMEKVPFLYGLLGMVVVRVIIVTVMVTQIASTLSPSAVLLNKVFLPGMQRSAPQHWPQHTAVGIILTSEL